MLINTNSILSFTTALAILPSALGAALIKKRDEVNYVFNLANGDIAPDGYTRSAVLVNGQFHGPTITANKDDTVNVQVTNSLTDSTMRRSTSIHWHGITQHTNAYQDGAAFVTQCPIGPNSTYTYSFDVPESGTYWYHSHLSTQYLDGLRGVIVVYDPDDPHASLYDVDDENTIITLADWWHTPSIAATAAYLSSSNVGDIESVPDSAMINGVGRYVGGPEMAWARLNVTQGQRYRFRIVNTSGIAHYRFAIQGHSLTVIEVDGISHEALTGDYIDVFPGQRYSVVVNANQTVDNYWVTAPATVRTSTNNTNFDPDTIYAVLHYDGADDADPTTDVPTASGTQLLEYNMVPLENVGITGTGDADQVFNVSFGVAIDSAGLTLEINDVAYVPPTLPTLLKILTGATESSDFNATENTNIINTKGSVIEINITGLPGHPFHLHGHSFDVVQSAGGERNLVNPPRRDVVVTAGATAVTIRFIADNPGPWFLHCHIDMHLEAGLAAVFVEAPSDIISGDDAVVPNAAWEGLCDAYYALDSAFQ